MSNIMESKISKGKILRATIVGAVAYVLYAQFLAEEASPVVTTKEGPVQGVVSYSRNGRTFYKFLGIPYAAPPVGELRFESPKSPLPWSEVKQVRRFGPECAQLEIMATGRILGKEDCLYLNVFTPKTEVKGKLLPVMFYIYGGLFMSGSADFYSADYFMDEDVVVVTINYRLAALGFLNTGDEAIRGNMGLKDQVMAMKWVKRNIQQFGGDPKRVTIFGESAGGASVHYHMISKQSAGLFHRAISQSGTALFKWVLNPTAPQVQATAFAKHFGCPTENTRKMVACLKMIPATELVQYHYPMMHPIHKMEDAFIPTIETTRHEDTFLTAHPMELIKNGSLAKIPWMAGVNSDEGLYLIARMTLNQTMMDNIGPQWSELAPKLLNYGREGNEDATEIIRDRFFGNEEINPSEMILNFSKLFSEYWFFNEFDRAIKLHLEKAPMYLYYFTYKSPLSLYPGFKASSEYDYIAPEVKMAVLLLKDLFSKYILQSPNVVPGACHADELPVLFRFHPVLYIHRFSDLFPISKEMIKTWTSFASAKAPLKFNGIEWPQMKPGETELKYMNLDLPGRVIKDPLKGVPTFWRDLNINFNTSFQALYYE